MSEALNVMIEIGTPIALDARGRIFDVLHESDFPGAPFRLTGRLAELPVRVEVTGRTVRYDVTGLRGVPVVRCRVIFVGDGEPDSEATGWVCVR